MRVLLQYKLLFFFLALICINTLSNNAYAFGCSSGGRTISVPVTLVDSSDIQLIVDVSQYITCMGVTGGGQNDALRTLNNTTISSALTSLGYTGYFTPDDGNTYTLPLSSKYCVWPAGSGGDSNCKISRSTSGYTPVIAKFSIKRTNFSQGGTIKSGTVIATLAAEQHSVSSWGWDITWDFVLANDLVVPEKACDIDTSTPSSVDLPPISASSLHDYGAYSSNVDFSIVLSNCSDNPNVFMTLTDAGSGGNSIPDIGVLANGTGTDMAENVGVQVLSAKNGGQTPEIVKLGEQFEVGQATGTHLTIPMAARYYRTSVNAIKGGAVSASVVYQMAYQ